MPHFNGVKMGEMGGVGESGWPFGTLKYPGQIGIILPEPTSGETNYGGVAENMPYGPVYAFPSFPFQHGTNQFPGGGKGQQWVSHPHAVMSGSKWSPGGYQNYW